ncbi:putative MADS [Lyophyllum shimeji]|uniref:MADS n=1 Tax=Lyophyllum shimeji TaxID=47721 RepID=A0A9P3UU04_LYOSH|nr:putative MADS [Lyophyllum shimeji]
MGRRKIEIQPITNERNRSVTFLKRKNGLFKKAHELGVLCSVDVAVIIFDERHGHDTKLFQYCSTDIRDVVQRHLRHTGERDTRGPADFSDAAGGAKHDNGDADDDDEDGDGDDLVPSAKKGGAGRNNDDEDYKPSARVITEPKNRPSISNERAAADSARSTLTLPTFPPIPQYDHQHPMSSDRLHPLHHQRPYEDQQQNKKPRLDYPLNVNTSHMLPFRWQPRSRGGLDIRDVLPATPGTAQQLPPAPPSTPAPPRVPALQRPLPSLAAPSHHGHAQGYNHHSFNAPHSNFPLGPQISSWGRAQHGSSSTGGASHPGGLPFFSGPGGHMGPGAGGYDGNTDSRFARGDDGRDTGGAGDDKVSRDSFASAFLEAEQQRKGVGVGVALPQGGLSLHPPPRGATATATSAASFGLDWPTHVRPPHQSAAPPPPRSSHPQPPSDAPSKSGDDASGAGAAAGEDAQQDAGGVGWLDLLSAGTPGTTVPSSSEGTTMPSPRSGSADTLASGAGA